MTSPTPVLAAAAMCFATFVVVPLGLGDAEAVTAPRVDRVEELLVPALVSDTRLGETPRPEAITPVLDVDLSPCLEAAPGWEQLVVWLEVEEDGTVLGLTPGSTEELPLDVATCLVDRVGEVEGGADLRSASVVLSR